MGHSADATVPSGRARSVVAIAFAATVIISLNATMFNIALPTVVHDLGATAGQGNWMLLAYLLVYTPATVLMGQVADSVDKRTVFLSGLALFTVTGLLLGLTPSAGGFIALRAMQALSAGMLVSTAGAMIAAVYPPSRLSGPMGIYLSGFAIAQAVGPVVGGVLATVVGWRWLFLLPVPIGLAALAWGWGVLRTLPSGQARGWRVDLRGNAVIFVMLGLLLYGVSQAQHVGWIDPMVLGTLVASMLTVPVFLAVERRAAFPALDLALLRDRSFSRANVGSFMLTGPRVVPAVLLGLYFQGIAGDDPLTAALKITPAAVALTVASVGAQRISRGRDERRVAMWSALAAAAGLGVLVIGIALDDNYPVLAVGMVVVGLACGVFSTLNSSIIMSSVPPERAGNINGLRVSGQTSSLAIFTGLGLTLLYGAVPGAQQDAFLSGDPAALTATSVALIERGAALAMGMLALAAVVGTLASKALVPRRG